MPGYSFVISLLSVILALVLNKINKAVQINKFNKN